MTTLLRLLQLVDSSFPTGGYAFSHGLEGLHAMRLVTNEEDVHDVSRTHIEETLAQQDLPADLHAHRLAADNDLDRLTDLDHLLSALKPVPVYRTASVRIGRQTLESALPLHPTPFALAYLGEVRQGETPGHHAVAFAVATHAAGIDAASAVAAFGAASLNGYVAAAVRLGVIGQGAAQRIVSALEPDLERALATAAALDIDQLGGYTPLLDIAGMRQPSLRARMFAS
ncbi:MAG: urease accessory protein [Chloroflexia bacterium]|nr:urease accessory protein [Chloroflexia bacterium]